MEWSLRATTRLLSANDQGGWNPAYDSTGLLAALENPSHSDLSPEAFHTVRQLSWEPALREIETLGWKGVTMISSYPVYDPFKFPLIAVQVGYFAAESPSWLPYQDLTGSMDVYFIENEPGVFTFVDSFDAQYWPSDDSVADTWCTD